jgi:hypothetical protein
MEERLDAARAGAPSAPVASQPDSSAVDALNARIDELTRRVDALGHPGTPAAAPGAADAAAAPATPPKRRGRPPKAGSKPRAASAPRVPLHEEIAAVINERGPQTAAELAAAIAERGRYAAPRSAKPLDAATVSARVSNPVYRSRFVRNEGRISLSTPE